MTIVGPLYHGMGFKIVILREIVWGCNEILKVVVKIVEEFVQKAPSSGLRFKVAKAKASEFAGLRFRVLVPSVDSRTLCPKLLLEVQCFQFWFRYRCHKK